MTTSQYFLVDSCEVEIIDKQTKQVSKLVKTTCLDKDGNVIYFWTLPLVDNDKLPTLPRVEVSLDTQNRQGKLSLRATEISFI